jgi:hypothetical protein
MGRRTFDLAVLLGGDGRLLREGRRWPLLLADCEAMLKYAAAPEPTAK